MTTKLPASIADLKQVLEAALLTANQPLSLDDMARMFVERVERTSLRMLNLLTLFQGQTVSHMPH